MTIPTCNTSSIWCSWPHDLALYIFAALPSSSYLFTYVLEAYVLPSLSGSIVV